VLPDIGTEILVGRDHQPRLLTAWLPDPVIRLCIARTHLHIRTTDDGLLATNLSSTVYVDDHPVHQHEDRLMLPGQVLSFMRADRSVNSTGELHPFLSLRVVPSAGSLSSAAFGASSLATQRRSWAPGIATQPALEEREAQEVQSTDRFLGKSYFAQHAGSLTVPTSTGLVQQQQPQQQFPAPVADERPLVCLELAGEQVLNGPASQRRVGPVSLAGKPLLVGSRHQPDLFSGIVMRGFTNLVDRDHFCIASEGGVFWLLCLSSKGLWRARGNEEPLRLILDDFQPLQHGDVIVPSLGAPDADSVERCSRALHWRFTVVLDVSS